MAERNLGKLSGPLPTLNGVRNKLRRTTGYIIRPGAPGLALLFAAFIVFNVLDLPRHAVVPVVVHDFVIVVVCLLLWWFSRGARIPLKWVHPIGAGLALLVLSNVFLTFWLTKDPFYTFYVGIVLIGAGGLLLSPRWVGVVIGLAVVVWAPLAWWSATPTQFAHYGFTLLAATSVAVALNIARYRTNVRVAQLDFKNAARKIELERALGMAENARKELDRKVDERTSELVEAYNELSREFEERKRLTTERRELESQLQHTQKMDSIGRLAGGVAHEFNNQLTMIMTSLQYAQMEGEPSPVIEECLAGALNAAGKSANITRQLLAFSRKQVMEPKVVSPFIIVSGIRKMLSKITGERVRLAFRTAETNSNIIADPGQIEQVMVNLVINACDAMPGGGTVTIALEEAVLDTDEALKVPAARPGRYVKISVSDTGQGMDEKTRAAVFEPFFTTKGKDHGTGLGLSVVHGIVTQHSGFATVASTPGEGSTFAVYLPVAGEQPAVQPAAEESAEMMPRGKETILLVEDEDEIRMLVVRVLRGLGYKVLEASSGERAVQIATEHPREIDLLVTDVVMPGMNGGQLAERVTEDRPRMQVLFVSGYGADVIESHGVLDEQLSFLPKPYEISTLARRVRALLERKRLNTPPRMRQPAAS